MVYAPNSDVWFYDRKAAVALTMAPVANDTWLVESVSYLVCKWTVPYIPRTLLKILTQVPMALFGKNTKTFIWPWYGKSFYIFPGLQRLHDIMRKEREFNIIFMDVLEHGNILAQ